MRTHLDLFSGIGGFSLAARWAGGIQTIGFSEIDEYCSAILKKHWPGVPNYGDVRTVPCDQLAGRVWLVTGGFPCQPFSCAGKRRGKEDDRFIWPAMCAVIKQVRPAWVLGENVLGIIGMELHRVQSDLEAIGYQCQVFVVPACAVDARHRRDRVWIVANAECLRGRKSTGDSSAERQSLRAPIGEESALGIRSGGEAIPDPDLPHRKVELPGRRTEFTNPSRWLPESGIRRVATGVSNRVDRLKALGNSIVPQVAEKFIRWMREAEENRETNA